MEHSEHDEEDDSEIRRLREKTAKGAVNIVGDVLDDPRIKRMIKKTLLPETIKNAIFMSAFLVGIMFIFNAVKQITGQGPYFDLVCGIALVFIGSICILSSMHSAKSI